MTESVGSAAPLGPNHPPPSPANIKRRRRRRRLLGCLLLLLLLLLLLAAAVLVLALTLFRARDPRIQLVSATITGVAPRLTLPALRLSLNVTLDLDILVYNPNRASFSHGNGTTLLLYRGEHVGDADVLPGRIPARGMAHVAVALTVDGGRLAAEGGSLVADALAGEIGFDSQTRIPGRVKFLGFIRHHAVAESYCHFGIGFPDLRVRRQECKQRTKL
ncbi:hypothetical protein AXF42_Ash013753 [Apostasia shenzhenica]|uniref:Late embryogenesis abundant protein LEA-2 subgroup domain-containing protein n=1 Tax=Apostasia shenzhenica TaxID=1088818 RepID=A0A2I0A4R5_9ASPA|nr:hypothetical protein AXF42_Ash013753 [Apostasia shenzhenica]